LEQWLSRYGHRSSPNQEIVRLGVTNRYVTRSVGATPLGLPAGSLGVWGREARVGSSHFTVKRKATLDLLYTVWRSRPFRVPAQNHKI
jgi:hypothetical protein